MDQMSFLVYCRRHYILTVCIPESIITNICILGIFLVLFSEKTTIFLENFLVLKNFFKFWFLYFFPIKSLILYEKILRIGVFQNMNVCEYKSRIFSGKVWPNVGITILQICFDDVGVNWSGFT